MQKRVNSVQGKIANQMRALDVATFGYAKSCERYNENTVKSLLFCCGLGKVVFREGNCQADRKLLADPT